MASDNQPDQDPLIDDRILDDDDNDDDHALDEVVVDGSYDDMFDTHEHVGGKNIRMTDPRPKSPSTTPPDSPIDSGLTNDPPQENLQSVDISQIQAHVTKIRAYIYTAKHPKLQLMLSTHCEIVPDFYTHKQQMHKLITKTRLMLLQQEPYSTMMDEGYSIYLSRPQLSYKVLAIEDNVLVDYVVDLNYHGESDRIDDNPTPFFEKIGEETHSYIDISFLFRIPTNDVPTRPTTKSQATSMSDEMRISAIIDLVRSPDVSSTAHLYQNPQPGPSRSSSTLRAGPLRFHTNPEPVHLPRPQAIGPIPSSRERPGRQLHRLRPYERLGPPPTHLFGQRSTSQERRRK